MRLWIVSRLLLGLDVVNAMGGVSADGLLGDGDG